MSKMVLFTTTASKRFAGFNEGAVIVDTFTFCHICTFKGFYAIDQNKVNRRINEFEFFELKNIY